MTSRKRLISMVVSFCLVSTAAMAEWLESTLSTRIMEVGEVLSSSSKEGWGGYLDHFFIVRVNERTQVWSHNPDSWIETGVYYCKVYYNDIFGHTSSMCSDRHNIYNY